MKRENKAPRSRTEKRQWAGQPLMLFVEGHSDLNFYRALLLHLGFENGSFWFHDLTGKNNLRPQAQEQLTPENLAQARAVAVLLDADYADRGSRNRFVSARDALQNAVNKNTGKDVTISEPNQWVAFKYGDRDIRFGIFIAAGSNGKGEIESLAWEAWSGKAENSKLVGCVESFVQCAEAHDSSLRCDEKNRIGALLSILSKDDPRLGPGARANIFDWAAPQFTPLIDFFRAALTPDDAG